TERAAALANAGPDSRVAEHGDEAEQHSGENGRAEGEGEDRPAHGDLVEPRQPRGRPRDEKPEGSPGQGEPAEAADEADHDALDDELRGDAPAARAERPAQGELVPPALGAHEEQVRDIGAGDQKDRADAAHENPEKRADVADDLLPERPQARREPRVLEDLEA